MNAFSNTATIFDRESGGKHRGYKFDMSDAKSFGFCKVINVAVNGENATENFHYISDLKDPEALGLFWKDEVTKFVRPDRTIGVIQLQHPIPPGGSVTLDIQFETKFPRVFARTGYWKTFFMVGQWFPKIAVFQGDKGWNCHLFHLNSEFFADFASYTVSLNVPSNYVVGATGYLKSQTKRENRTTYTYSVENVHDFAWTAWDHWKTATDQWKDVKLVLLYPPGHEGTVTRQMNALKAGLNGYADLCGFDYPYKKFTLVDPPMQAAGAGGMEYPMLVTGLYPTPLLPKAIRIPEEVIVHEFGHNYFYGMLASNEFENAWMDEGLNSYATAYATAKAYGNSIDYSFLTVGPFAEGRLGFSAYKGADVPAKAAWEFASFGGYATMAYNKPTIYLRTLQNMIGNKTFVNIFRTYFQQFKFTHPKPDDFLNIVNEVGGEQARDFVYRMLYTRDKIDYAVRKATSKKKPEFHGLQDFKMKENKKTDTKADDKESKEYWNTITVENRGDFQYPVSVDAELKDGTKREFQWDGKNGWHRFEFVSTSPMTVAVVDPNHVYACDVSLKNNAYVLDSQTGQSTTKLAVFLSECVQMIFNIISLAV